MMDRTRLDVRLSSIFVQVLVEQFTYLEKTVCGTYSTYARKMRTVLNSVLERNC